MSHGRHRCAQRHAERSARQAGIQEAFSGEILRSRHSRRSSPNSTRSPTPPGKPTTTTTRARARGKPARVLPTRTMTCRSSGCRRAPTSRRPNAGTRTRNHRRAFCWSTAPRAASTPVPGEMSKTYRLVMLAKEIDRAGRRLRGRSPRPVAARLRIRPRHLSVQGLRLDRAAALPLAVLLLSQPRARPGRRLDGRASIRSGWRRTAS